MDRNPYAPPVAIVDDVEPAHTTAQTSPFFAVSIAKLVILSVCTLGLFCYQCFSRIRAAGAETGITPALAAGALATVNRINAAVSPGHDANARLTGWNWLWIAVGGSILVLAMIGLFLPEQ